MTFGEAVVQYMQETASRARPCAEGDEARPQHGHLDRVEPLVNPIRFDSCEGRRENMSRLLRLAIALALLGLLALVPRATGAQAQSLNPPPIPGATCTSGNGATICSISMPFNNGPYDTGVSCGTFEILEHDIGTVTSRWHYDTSGTATIVTTELQQPVGAGSTLSNSVTGFSLPMGVHELITYTDFKPSSGDFQGLKVAGQFAISTLPTVGLVFNQSGTFSYALPLFQLLHASHLLTQAALNQEDAAICRALS
jgi:hypothetical protein